MNRVAFWLPLVASVIFFAVVALGLLRPDDQLHRSKMIGRPLPAFALPQGSSGRPTVSRADFKGAPKLMNVFASWCVPCIAEAPVLGQIAAQGAIIEGIAIRDKRPDVDTFLARNGNPYRAIGLDADSSIQLAIGSSGVPETFVIDGNGIIQHQHIGAITPGDVPAILQALEAAK